MKKEVNTLRLLTIAAIIILTVILLPILKSKQVDYNHLTEVTIQRLGTMMPSGDEYKLSLKNGVWVASHNEIEWFEDNIQEINVGEEFVNDIKNILAENKVHKWDGFNKENPIVTDGERFTFYMCFSDGTKIEASGYMTYPKNFYSVFDAFKEKYFLLFEGTSS